MLQGVMRAAAWAGLMDSLARPYEVMVPGANQKPTKAVVFLPHENLEKLVRDSYLSAWCLSPEQVGAPTGLGPLLRRWNNHADVGGRHQLEQVMGIGWHCDGVQYSSSSRAGDVRSVLVSSFNVITAQTVSDRASRILFFVIGKKRLCDCGCNGYHTFQALFRVFAWSMDCLNRGESPNCRHDGSPWTASDLKNRLAGGAPLPAAGVLQIRGDWQWLADGFRFPTWSSESFCWLCRATKHGELSYMDFTPGAAHRQTLRTHEDYMLGCARIGSQPSTMFLCPGVTLDMIAIDSMHAGDLGQFQSALGSLFWLHVTRKAFFRTKKEGLDHLNAELASYYAANRGERLAQLGQLTMSQIRSNDPRHPSLKAKAAQTRRVVRFAVLLARRHEHGDHQRGPFRFAAASRLTPHVVEHRRVCRELFEGLQDYHDSCKFVPFDAQRCKDGMYRFLQSLRRLHEIWRDGVDPDIASRMPFAILPKSHLLHHLVEDQLPLWGSPSTFWCYGDEDFVGTIKKAAMGSKHPGPMELRVSEKCMIRAGCHRLEMAAGVADGQ